MSAAKNFNEPEREHTEAAEAPETNERRHHADSKSRDRRVIPRLSDAELRKHLVYESSLPDRRSGLYRVYRWTDRASHSRFKARTEPLDLLRGRVGGFGLGHRVSRLGPQILR